ncbi:type III polyketide synthase [Flaviaesturariibacter amylovorans]|uniref:Type III polyketide synthase n=1 Tax=Flaviaesturariibacter amylovorans TaxID=1084520 RepID=A0ABP8G8H5_9BACT
MSKILSIGTAVPAHCHPQPDIMRFTQLAYATNEADRRKMRFMYNQSGIDQRYSVLPDYSRPASEWTFYPATEGLDPFPSLEQRMAVYNKQAPALSVDAIRDCLKHDYPPESVTHLITVSCTGMSAPGLDLQIVELLDLPRDIFRTSVNFMGCYAALHALRLGDALCRGQKDARVLIVCTELCTLHFQRGGTMDNIASALLFGDGSAAVLLAHDDAPGEGLHLTGFRSEVVPQGKRDMAWELSSTGFQMTLSNYIPELIEEDFGAIMDRALADQQLQRSDVTHWCIHPGGRRILEAIQKSIGMAKEQLADSYEVLRQYGNLSSATVLFVLKRMLDQRVPIGRMAGAAFGPGLTVETFTAHTR